MTKIFSSLKKKQIQDKSAKTHTLFGTIMAKIDTL